MNNERKSLSNLNELNFNESIITDNISNDNINNTSVQRKKKRKRTKNNIDDIENSFQTQVKFFKNLYLEYKKKFNELSEQIKDLLNHVNVNQKTKLQISQIYQILGYSPRTIQLKIGTKINLLKGLFEKK